MLISIKNSLFNTDYIVKIEPSGYTRIIVTILINKVTTSSTIICESEEEATNILEDVLKIIANIETS